MYGCLSHIKDNFGSFLLMGIEMDLFTRAIITYNVAKPMLWFYRKYAACGTAAEIGAIHRLDLQQFIIAMMDMGFVWPNKLNKSLEQGSDGSQHIYICKYLVIMFVSVFSPRMLSSF